MEIHHRHLSEPNPEEAKELENLKAIIERAIADGRLSHAEFERIRAATLDNHPSAEQLSRELQLYRQLVTEKIQQGMIEFEAFE
jgi:hypothetical protein